jgi:hypothetical protein
MLNRRDEEIAAMPCDSAFCRHLTAQTVERGRRARARLISDLSLFFEIFETLSGPESRSKGGHPLRKDD